MQSEISIAYFSGQENGEFIGKEERMRSKEQKFPGGVHPTDGSDKALSKSKPIVSFIPGGHRAFDVPVRCQSL